MIKNTCPYCGADPAEKPGEWLCGTECGGLRTRFCHRIVERQLRAEIERLQTMLNCRAGKLLQKGTYFVVVAEDEPYYTHVYDLIRKHERHHGRWTDEDEAIYQDKTAHWSVP